MTVSSNELRAAGLKSTLPRRKILEVMETQGSRHVSAEDIYRTLLEADEDVGLATVYRVLTQFEAAGLVTKLNFEGGHSVYELNQGEHHDHILCVKCGKVDEFVDELIEERQKEIAEKAGFSMTDHCLYIYGICAECQKEDAGDK
ncbi:MAG: ferric iron uptake transcriptional regulator [Ectothiorhodospiraceae bacterium]|nr:ferric iron uptake transcriptional regulator [Ectothiorhodospiraceae bacterium]